MQPEKIGHYEIKSELGRGGMATVYRGYDARFEREVAIKVLPPEMLHADPNFRLRFEREAKIIAQLEHPSIVPVYDVGEDNHQPYFVMRYMRGGSLSERIKAGVFPLEAALGILEQVAPGLDEAHAKGIVHRDLKPSNILFNQQGVPHISDFGIAKMMEEAGNVTGSAILGTPAYMAPEQASGNAVDGRADVYALGVILYEMLTGQQPYQADTPMGVVVKHITEPVPEILREHPDLSSEVDEVIKKAMSKNPDERYVTAIELARALNKAAFGEEGQVTDPQVTRPKLAAITSGRKRIGWIVGGAVVGLIVVAGFLFLNGGPLSGQAEASPTAAPLPTSTSTSVPPTETPVPTEPLVAAATAMPTSIGGATQVAFLLGNEIWLMNLDGSDTYPLTNDDKPKSSLGWSADGKSLYYLSNNCAMNFEVDTRQAEVIACFEGIEYLDGFRLSPDGKRVAISLDRELFIVPFDAAALKTARNRAGLLKIKDACLDDRAAVKEMRWSQDGKSLAVIFRDPVVSLSDAVRVLDVSHCPPSAPVRLDDFPTGRFEISYKLSPIIPSFSWDGLTRFLFNDVVRYEGFGDLYLYDLRTHQGQKLNPIEGACCYRDARWSPDGKYVLLLFQNFLLGQKTDNQLYYAPAEALTTGEFGEPIPIPFDLQTNPRAAPQFEFRPAQ